MSLRRVVFWGLAGHLGLLAASLRHNFVWGEGREILGIPLPLILGIAEGTGLLLFALMAGLSYARGARRAGEESTRALTIGGCVLLLAAIAVPPFLSTDVFDNLARGRVEAVHGANPYSMPPAQFPEDPFTEAANWTKYGNPYGPVSSLVQTGLCTVTGDNVWVGVYAFKLLCGLCHLATAWLIYLAVARLRPEPDHARLAYFLYLWNPWILLETAGNAHNDAVMTLGLAATLAAVAHSRWIAGTTFFGLAVLTKHSIAIFGPLLLALAIKRDKLKPFAVGVGASAVLTAYFVYRYFLEDGAVQALTAQADHQRTSLQHFASLLLGVSSSPITIAGYVLTIGYLALCWRRVVDLGSFGMQSARLMLFFILVGMPMFSPWYHLWWLPLVAVWAWSGWTRVFSWVAVLGPLSYLVFASTRSLGLTHEIWTWGVGLVPIAALVLAARK